MMEPFGQFWKIVFDLSDVVFVASKTGDTGTHIDLAELNECRFRVLLAGTPQRSLSAQAHLIQKTADRGSTQPKPELVINQWPTMADAHNAKENLSCIGFFMVTVS
jgi:hypothetical protein